MKEEKNYTAEELEEMANALLESNAPAETETEKGKPHKKARAKKEAPPAPEKTPEERLNELLEKGKKAGKLTSKELECLEDMNLDGEAIDKFYEALEQNGIDIDMPTTDVLPPLDDLVPEVDDLADIEEVTEEEINAADDLADTYATDDPVRMYLKEIGKIKLLSPEEEQEVGRRISEGDELLVYLPGTPVSVLNEDQRMWAHLLGDEAPEALENWFLYSAANESGFVGYFMDDATLANPWADMTADELAQVSGVTLNLPEGAQDAVYRWLESESLAELQFTLDGDEYCARVKPDALEAGQLDNISGMYFEWEHEEEITVGHCPGTIGLAQTGSSDYTELCLWYDVAPGLMYSLSVYTTDPDGLDLTAVAAMVYEPMQGEA